MVQNSSDGGMDSGSPYAVPRLDGRSLGTSELRPTANSNPGQGQRAASNTLTTAQFHHSSTSSTASQLTTSPNALQVPETQSLPLHSKTSPPQQQRPSQTAYHTYPSVANYPQHSSLPPSPHTTTFSANLQVYASYHESDNSQGLSYSSDTTVPQSPPFPINPQLLDGSESHSSCPLDTLSPLVVFPQGWPYTPKTLPSDTAPIPGYINPSNVPPQTAQTYFPGHNPVPSTRVDSTFADGTLHFAGYDNNSQNTLGIIQPLSSTNQPTVGKKRSSGRRGEILCTPCRTSKRGEMCTVDINDPTRCAPCVKRKREHCGPRMLPKLSIESLRREAQGDRLTHRTIDWFSRLTPEDQELVVESVGPEFRLKVAQAKSEGRLPASSRGINDLSGFDNNVIDPYSTATTCLDDIPNPEDISHFAPPSFIFGSTRQQLAPSFATDTTLTAQFDDTAPPDNEGKTLTDSIQVALHNLHSHILQRYDFVDRLTIDAAWTLALRSAEQGDEIMRS